MVVRYQGGSNAGHTVWIAERFAHAPRAHRHLLSRDALCDGQWNGDRPIAFAESWILARTRCFDETSISPIGRTARSSPTTRRSTK
ncbi:MAG: hypothetical protein IMW91_05415 [Firmicutes bacterium]|nr:hypothetical protein [Bacillota bacterium]